MTNSQLSYYIPHPQGTGHLQKPLQQVIPRLFEFLRFQGNLQGGFLILEKLQLQGLLLQIVFQAGYQGIQLFSDRSRAICFAIQKGKETGRVSRVSGRFPLPAVVPCDLLPQTVNSVNMSNDKLVFIAVSFYN